VITPLSFTMKYSKITNVIFTPVHICYGFEPFGSDKPPEPKEFIAIWDTGATGTVITKNVINGCKLKPISVIEVRTASKQVEKEFSHVFLVNIFLPNKIMIPKMRVCEGNIFGKADILIGMDIISQGDFAITNHNNKTMFSFRMPSMLDLDFVQMDRATQGKIKKFNNVDRNDLCPCGSGKKYKNCCGKIV